MRTLLVWLTAAAAAYSCTADGTGQVRVTGDLKQWHKVTVSLDGPCATERNSQPNPFLDYRMTVTFAHESGSPRYEVPGYFAADGNAGNTSAESGTVWRAHVSPDKPGRWTYQVALVRGKNAAVEGTGEPVARYNGQKGEFRIGPTDKKGRDFRAKGRLQYVGGHYLQFAGTREYFLKAGTDSPETLLGYKDFDGTETRKVPLKTYEPHRKDWRTGDPTWGDGKGKGLIGALNYLASEGMNALSFLTYNAAGDGDNVWPFVERDDKLHYDCSKLDQWQIVFDHAQAQGLYLHFKLQETENDDQRLGGERKPGKVPQALDGGQTGVERKLYLREMIARFGHSLALNWNLSEESTQTAEEQRAMAQAIADFDPYDHHRVVHTHPPQQDEIYSKMLGEQSVLTGASLQNNPFETSHQKTLKWLRASAKAGKPWVIATDEQGTANLGVPPDPGYAGFNGNGPDGKPVRTLHDIRKYVLWGTLLAGGAGVEYYFGYQLPQNDLVAEDLRSRDKTWDFARFALDFMQKQRIPYHEMKNMNALAGNTTDDNSVYCFAKPGEIYLVYLPKGGTAQLDLSGVTGSMKVRWFDPRNGGSLKNGPVTTVKAGAAASLGQPPSASEKDWLAVVSK